MANPTAAMLVIGDEILSGRTRDSNMYHLAQVLTEAGIDLSEVRIVPDDHGAIVAALDDLRRRWDHVFTSGGIGPTHDDITADAVAAAFGVPIAVREDARALLVAHYARTGGALNAARLRMARIPEGARLIENLVSAAPGFAIGNVHVMAGVPSVFEAMVAAEVPGLAAGVPFVARTVTIPHPEGTIAEVLTGIAAEFPEVRIGSYPFHHGEIYGADVVMRAPERARVDAVAARLHAHFPDADG